MTVIWSIMTLLGRFRRHSKVSFPLRLSKMQEAKLYKTDATKNLRIWLKGLKQPRVSAKKSTIRSTSAQSWTLTCLTVKRKVTERQHTLQSSIQLRRQSPKTYSDGRQRQLSLLMAMGRLLVSPPFRLARRMIPSLVLTAAVWLQWFRTTMRRTSWLGWNWMMPTSKTLSHASKRLTLERTPSPRSWESLTLRRN